MEATRLRPRLLVAIGVAVALVALVIGIVVSTAPMPNPIRHGAAYVDPQIATKVPASFTGVPPHAVAPTLTQQDTRTLISEPWEFISLDGRHLEIVYLQGNGTCELPRGFAVTYSKTTVEVAALSHACGDLAIADMAVIGRAVLTLPEPLNGRDLVHAPTDQQWRRDVLTE
ncbi:hypothetical protein G3T36_12800 [Diaminobutyricibacter tongyongensis]|uniref:Uncharacterized protein n=1 Tax=Leifsonia tongyongensis TaxID=1268043 RepID=A0A6L9XZN8_9MICO|nr:hypothetical protein [Diaminobutyricibacter tongyongensis]NEN06745.1 hypothetical protein [Diaminobutyricibacter tongyongensis]